MSIAKWHLPVQPETQAALKGTADALRGEDLLVDLGRDEFLLLLPRTGHPGGGDIVGTNPRQDRSNPHGSHPLASLCTRRIAMILHCTMPSSARPRRSSAAGRAAARGGET